MIGRTISHYRIIGKLGSGGMGVVYRAEDLKLGRFVALKFLSEQTAADPVNLGRFRREARAVSALNHPNICTIYEIDEAEGHIFIAMELLEGRSLDTGTAGKSLIIEKLLSVALQVAAGLEAAHSKGIIHRDIKPGNLFLNSQGQVKILDFGLAKLDSNNADEADGSEMAATRTENLTESGSTLGTIAYMSPEQARGDEIDTRSDLFSAGSVLYELATGAPAFPGRTAAIVLDAVLNREPVSARELNPLLPAELGRIIEKCLEKDREVRYQHAADLGADLKRLKRDSGSETSSVVRASAGSSSAIFEAAKRHRLGSATALIVVLGLVAAAVYGIYDLARTPERGPFESYTLSQVTDFGDLENAAISPDGKYLAYVRAGKGTGKARNLWLRQLSTNSDTQVLSSIETVASLSFSPDQSYLFFRITDPEHIWRANLYRVPFFGGKPQVVVQDIDGNVSLVDDGRQLCFQRGGVAEPLSYSVILRDSKTGTEQLLLQGAGRAEAMACSPNGKTAAFFLSSGLSRGLENDLSVASLPNGKSRVLARLGLGRVAVDSMVWLPSQEGVIFTKGTEPGFRAQLIHVAYSDGNQRQITNDLNEYESIGISSDGKILSSLKKESARSFYAWSPEQAKAPKIAEFLKDTVYFWWSDPEKILFSTPGMNLKVANLTTGASTNVGTDPTHKLWGPSLCGPDDVVAAGFGSDDGSQGIWKLNLTTGVYKQITNGFDDLSPQCTKDGKWIVYAGGENIRLMRVPTEGGTPTEIPGQGSWFDLSPDGTKLVDMDFRNNEPNGKLEAVIHLVSTNNWKEIATIPLGTMSNPIVRFMPDGKSAAFATIVDGKENLWVKPFDGEAVRQLTHFDSTDSIQDFHWSPDGKKLGIIRERVSADAVLFRDVEK